MSRGTKGTRTAAVVGDCWLEPNVLTIKELDSDITASSKVTAEDLVILAFLKENGVVSALKENGVLEGDAKARLDLKKSRRMVPLLVLLYVLLLLLLLLSITHPGLVALVTAMYKDTYVKGDTSSIRPTITSNANDQVVGLAPVLSDDELFSVETIRVYGSLQESAGPAEGDSGEAINEAIPGVVNSFRISRVEKVNATAVVFHALGGEQIRVWNGETTVRLTALGPEIPVCSANVTCAAFQVDGAELTEKNLTDAKALPVPFAEGRRRLTSTDVTRTFIHALVDKLEKKLTSMEHKIYKWTVPHFEWIKPKVTWIMDKLNWNQGTLARLTG